MHWEWKLPPLVTAKRILMLLGDGKPRCSKEIREKIGLSRDSIESSLIRLWKKR